MADVKEMVENAKLSKTIEVFHTSHTNENGETVPFGIKVQNRYPAVGLALKQALENSKR
jgi:hypothetical protein